MPQGSFNVSRLLRAVGLKNVIEMPVTQTVQPTIPLMTMAGQVPVHTAPQAFGGGVFLGSVGEASVCEIVSLDPGGVIVQTLDTGGGSVIVVPTLQDAPFVWGLAGPIALPLEQTQPLTPVVSLMNLGSGGGAPASTLPRFAGRDPFPNVSPGFYLPKGRRLILSTLSLNALLPISVILLGIQATEAEE